MKVKIDGKVMIINDSLKDRYVSLGYEIVEDKTEDKKRVSDVSTHADADKKK